jgi:hypothetical protein
MFMWIPAYVNYLISITYVSLLMLIVVYMQVHDWRVKPGTGATLLKKLSRDQIPAFAGMTVPVVFRCTVLPFSRERTVVVVIHDVELLPSQE